MLLDEALKAGISALEYWDMTPWEVNATIHATNWRLDYEHKERAWLAWHTAALIKTRQMPPLKDLTAKPKSRLLSEKEAKEHKNFHKKAVDALPERFKKKLSDKGD